MKLSTLASAATIMAMAPRALSQLVEGTPVGPQTPLSDKVGTVCNVLDYGGVADGKTDVGAAINRAFKECVLRAGGYGATLYVPPGEYSISTGASLTGGTKWAFQLDGMLTLTPDGNFGGNAILVNKATDFEFFSSNNLGAIQGNGYLQRISGSSQAARLLRFSSCVDYSVHHVILIDSPVFHLNHFNARNLLCHSITIRGGDKGGLDGVDVVCTSNCHLHHIEVTNRDECVCVKSPSKNVLIEDIYCNRSGGMSIGSLNAPDAPTIEYVHMRRINVHQCTQMLMIKTWPGGTGASGYVRNGIFEDFVAYDTTYALLIDQYWYGRETPNTGAVKLSSLRFSRWSGTVNNGMSRGPIMIKGSNVVPATDITLEDFVMWTETRDSVILMCRNVYGRGYCARELTIGAEPSEFSSTITLKAAPTGFVKPTRPAWGVSGYGTTVAIPVYTPAVMWDAAGGGVGKQGVPAPTSSTPPAPTLHRRHGHHAFRG